MRKHASAFVLTVHSVENLGCDRSFPLPRPIRFPRRNEIDADERIARERNRSFPAQKTGRRGVSQPDFLIRDTHEQLGNGGNLRMDNKSITSEEATRHLYLIQTAM